MLGKRFFYISAGLLCLAVLFHLVARTAQGQAGRQLLAIQQPAGGCEYLALDTNGTVYLGCGGAWSVAGQLPGPATCMMALPSSPSHVVFGMVNGDIYEVHDTRAGTPFTFTFVSNVFNGPTLAQPETWGALKQRYR